MFLMHKILFDHLIVVLLIIILESSFVVDGAICNNNKQKEGPGFGFNIITKRNRQQIYEHKFETCNLVEGQFLIPDGFIYRDLNKDQTTTTTFTSHNFSQYQGELNIAFGIQSSVLPLQTEIAGKASAEFDNMREIINWGNTVMYRYQIQIFSFEITQPGKVNFTEEFKSTATSLVEAVKSNNEVKAKWEADKIIKNYGTQVATTITFGGIATTFNFIREDAVIAANAQKIGLTGGVEANVKSTPASVSASLAGQCKNDLQEFVKKNNLKTEKATIGGNIHLAESNLSMWRASVDDNPSPIQKELTPIEEVIRHFITDQSTYDKVIEYLSKAANTTYRTYLVKDCTDVDAFNFQQTAFLDNGNCNYTANLCSVDKCKEGKRMELIENNKISACSNSTSRICGSFLVILTIMWWTELLDSAFY